MKTTLSLADITALQANNWRSRECQNLNTHNINTAKKGQPADLVACQRAEHLLDDILQANYEILDTDNPTHVDNDTLPTVSADYSDPLTDEVQDNTPTTKGIVGLFVGHTPGTGAVAINGEDEHGSANRAAVRAAANLEGLGYRAHVIYRNERLGYAEAMSEHGATAKRLGLDVSLEIHRNAYDGQPHGAEVIVSSHTTAATLGSAFIQATSETYPLRIIRGVRVKTSGRGYLFNANQPCPSAIYEPCFFDSVEWYDYSGDLVGREATYIANIIERFFNLKLL